MLGTRINPQHTHRNFFVCFFSLHGLLKLSRFGNRRKIEHNRKGCNEKCRINTFQRVEISPLARKHEKCKQDFFQACWVRTWYYWFVQNLPSNRRARWLFTFVMIGRWQQQWFYVHVVNSLWFVTYTIKGNVCWFTVVAGPVHKREVTVIASCSSVYCSGWNNS